MTITDTAEELARLLEQSRALDENIAQLEDQLINSMISGGETKFEHQGYVFIKIPEKNSPRVDYREFYTLASQHEMISANVLEEIVSQCTPIKRRVGYLQIRRPRN